MEKKQEVKTLWFAQWSYSRPTLCRVGVIVRASTYKVTSFETFLGYWSHQIVYPKDSSHFFDTVGEAINYLRVHGQEVEQSIIDKLRSVQAHNRKLSELISELEASGTVNFGDV